VQRLARGALFVVAFLPADLACSGDCVGAGCEEEFDADFGGLFLGVTDRHPIVSPLDADVVVIGDATQGPDWDVAIGAARLIVGTPTDGTVRAFGTDLTFGTKVPLDTAPGVLAGSADDSFGASVAILDDLNGDGAKELLVGAPTYDAGTVHDGGAVYLYSGLGTNLGTEVSAEPTLRVAGESTSLHFGEVVRACADMDGDGLPEWAAAAPRSSRTADLSGEVALASSRDLALLDPEILMGDLGSDKRSGAVFWGSSLGAVAGSALDCSHDATGDGLADLWIGAPYANGTFSGEGAVYLVPGGSPKGPGVSGDLETAATATLRGESAEAWLGSSIATGLFDGDVAVAVGAPGASGSGDTVTSTGEVLVWRGGDFGSEPALRISGEEEGDRFGETVAFGDVDGDGFDDLLVGAPHHNPDPNNSDAAFQSGALYIFLGALDLPATLLATDADLEVVEAAQYLRTGDHIAVGDYDADGLTDFVIVNRYDPASSPFNKQ
jgi:hypothetical protein